MNLPSIVRTACLATIAGLSISNVHAQFTGFANNGLVGVGDITADTHDASGQDDIGAIFSSMAVNQGSIHITTNGSGNKVFTGTLYGQSDRGYNNEDSGQTTDFHPRLTTFSFSLTAMTSSPGAGGQITLNNTSVTLYHDPKGNNFTGLDSTSASTVANNGVAGLPESPINNHISLDLEGLTVAPDGTYYSSDEYGPVIYHWDTSGNLLNTIIPPAAFTPITGGVVNYTSEADPTDSGRCANAGLEGLSFTPDGKYLVTMMQHPLVQDGGTHLNSSGKTDGQNVRLLMYNATGPNAGQLAHEYIYCCLHFNSGDHNKDTGVSEVLALNDTQFLVLDRDTSGRGTANNNTPSFKAVMAIDVSTATDIANTGFDKQAGASGQFSLPVAAIDSNPTTPTGTNISGFGTVVPARQTVLVNLIDTTQLSRFGQNVSADWNKNKNAIVSNNASVPEKLEGMGLIPENDPTKPNNFILLVGSDNDYITQAGVWENGAIAPSSANDDPPGFGPGETNDTKIYAYEVTLPGASVLAATPPTPGADSPAMPTWLLTLMGAALLLGAVRFLPARAQA